MSFADLLERETQSIAPRTIDKILAALDDSDRADALDAIRDPEVGPTVIARVLFQLAPQFARKGSAYTDKTVKAHPEWRYGA